MAQRRRRSSSQSSQYAYPGVAVHYDATPLSYQQYQSSSFDEVSTGMSSLLITNYDRTSFPSVQQNNNNNRAMGALNNYNNTGNKEYEMQEQNFLQSNLVTLRNTILRNYHLHTIAQYHKAITYLLFYFIPTTLLTLAGGVITFVATYEFGKEKDRDLFEILITTVCLALICATFWHANSNFQKPWSQSVLHCHLAKELHKLSNRLEHRYEDDHDFDFYNSFLQPEHQQQKKRKRLRQHEMTKFHALYDQIQACYDQYTSNCIPQKYIKIYHALELHVQTILGPSLYDNNHEVQWWLMPLLYQYLFDIVIRNPIWHGPSWYVEQTIKHFLKCYTRKDYSIKTTKRWIKQQEHMTASIIALQNARDRQQLRQRGIIEGDDEDDDDDHYEDYERETGESGGGGGERGEYSDFYTLDQEAATPTTAASSTLDRPLSTRSEQEELIPQNNTLIRGGDGNDDDEEDLLNLPLSNEAEHFENWDDDMEQKQKENENEQNEHETDAMDAGNILSSPSNNSKEWKEYINGISDDMILDSEEEKDNGANASLDLSASEENRGKLVTAATTPLASEDSDDNADKIVKMTNSDEKEEEGPYNDTLSETNDEEKEEVGGEEVRTGILSSSNNEDDNSTTLVSSLHDAGTVPHRHQQLTSSLSPPRTTKTNSIRTDSDSIEGGNNDDRGEEAVEYEERGSTDDEPYSFELNRSRDESTASDHVILLLRPVSEPSTLSNPTEVSFDGEEQEQDAEERRIEARGPPTSEPSTASSPSVISFGPSGTTNSDDEDDDDDPMKRSYFAAAGGGFPSTTMMSSNTPPYPMTMVPSRLSTIDSYTTSADVSSGVSGSQSRKEM